MANEAGRVLAMLKPATPVKKMLAQPAAVVPPQHWAYQQLFFLAQRGLITGQPLYNFLGGRTYTRGEVAQIIKAVLVQVNKGEEVLNPDNAHILQLLISEFQPELDALKVDTRLGYAELQKIKNKVLLKEREGTGRNYVVSGSSTTSYTRQLEEKNYDLKENLILNGRSRNSTLHLSLSGKDADFTQTEAGLREQRVGGKYLVGLDNYSLEMNNKLGKKRRDLKTILGFTGGSSYSQGVTVGNLNLEGANFSLGGGKNIFDFVAGRTQGEDPDEVAAFHVGHKFNDNLTLHLQTVGAQYDPSGSTGAKGIQGNALGGIGLEGTHKETHWMLEMSMKSSEGSGYFLQVDRMLGKNLELNFLARQYDHFQFDYNSPIVYSGISGGDDSTDHGVGLNATYQVDEFISLTMTADSSFEATQGDLLYLMEEADYSKGPWGLSATYEREWVEERYNHITSLRVERKFTESLKAAIDWSRELVESAGSDNSRLSMTHDFIKDILSFTANVSNRNSSNGRNLSQQFSVNWNRNAFEFFSFQTTWSVPDSSKNSAELNFLMKF